ncbi:hypothetical protein AVEN_42221-1 [Araneus ventricosus]|uniref:Uncharacterized protein n=1 Tax=Araneus ventricosus TaxID=182803 RepID=A0A4Y2B0U7_ARAVE|nr:hypothetical protein AVEN_42221-1 [Araneus ventricosus]
MKRSIKIKRGRDIKPKKKYKRKLYDCNMGTEKEGYIVKRDRARREIEYISSNNLPQNQELGVDKLYPKKKTINLKTKRGSVLGLCKRASFKIFTILEQCFMVRRKRISAFWIKKA